MLLGHLLARSVPEEPDELVAGKLVNCQVRDRSATTSEGRQIAESAQEGEGEQLLVDYLDVTSSTIF